MKVVIGVIGKTRRFRGCVDFVYGSVLSGGMDFV